MGKNLLPVKGIWSDPGSGQVPHAAEQLSPWRGRAGGCARVTAGQSRPHLGLCPGPNVPLQGPQGSQVCIPDSPRESGLMSKGSKGGYGQGSLACCSSWGHKELNTIERLN